MSVSTAAKVFRRPAAARCRRIIALVVCASLVTGGCSSTSGWVKVRDTPHNPLSGTLNLVSRQGPKPTERTLQLLRRYNLADQLNGDRAVLLGHLEEIQQREPHRENEYAMAELAYVTAKQSEVLPGMMQSGRALEYYATALTHAYRYLFDYQGELAVNDYDPQFRGASDLYNESLEGMLRLVRQGGEVRPGTTRTIKTTNHLCTYDVVLHSKGWHDDDLDRFEFVSDFQVQGLRNHYHSYGLGVPLIAVRKTHGAEQATEQFYPPDLCYPLTAFLRVSTLDPNLDRDSGPAGVFGPPPMSSPSASAADPAAPHFVLDLYDPLDQQSIEVAGRTVPLEADLSTPLAYFLDRPQFKDADLSTLGLLKPGEAKKLEGLYMLEPFQPDKMPVVMVHGLWSSPVTWMEMYNDLRSDPAVRDHYQFWFYLYPSGQPFWFSGTQMRESLAMMRRELDPERRYPALDQMVLVGHSMGGLVSKMQSVESGDAFWHTTSDHPFAELKADPAVRRSLANSYFFDPSPSVRTVITIGTPHRGSQFANDTTRWLGHKLITLPGKMLTGREELLTLNPGFFRPNSPIGITTSIDSLAPDSPLLPPLLAAAPGPWITYHNIVGRVPDLGWRRYFTDDGDGVVSLTSARLDQMPQVASQIVVPADHVNLHRHPESILEVRRILLEQLAELQAFPDGRRQQIAIQRSDEPPETASVPWPNTAPWPSTAIETVPRAASATSVLSR
jgi:pimeloyl-ACP methyl ester carboxylesterase